MLFEHVWGVLRDRLLPDFPIEDYWDSLPYRDFELKKLGMVRILMMKETSKITCPVKRGGKTSGVAYSYEHGVQQMLWITQNHVKRIQMVSFKPIRQAEHITP